MTVAAPDILVRRGLDRSLVGTVVISAILHAAALGLLIAMPTQFLSPPDTMQSYTVDLVAPDVLGGTQLVAGAGKPSTAVKPPMPALPDEPKAAAPAVEAPPASQAEPAAVNPPAPAQKPEAQVPKAPEPVQPREVKPAEPKPVEAKPVEHKPEAKAVEPERPAANRVQEAPKPAEPPHPIVAAEPKPAAVAKPQAAEAKPPAARAPEPIAKAESKPPEPKPVAKPPEPAQPAARPAEAQKPPPAVKNAPVAEAAKKPLDAPPTVSAAEREAEKRDATIAAAIQRRSAAAQNGSGAPASALDKQIAAAVQRRAQQVGTGGGTDAAAPGGPISVGPGSGVGGTPTDLQYILYKGKMDERIKAAWAWTGADKTLRAVIQFNLTPEGEIRSVRTIESSGNTQYDASCERAVRISSPLEPVPEKYREVFATVEMTFKPTDMER